jgi:hypothetical protein
MEESPMVFEHPSVNRSWLSYEIGKDRSMTAILHVQPKQEGTVESELADAIVQFMRSRGDIESCGGFAPEHRLIDFGIHRLTSCASRQRATVPLNLEHAHAAPDL